jgi:hypothetical protein
MLTAQKSPKQKNSEKIIFLKKGFLYILASGLSPYNDAFLTYSAKSTKIRKSRSNETWAVEILPP